MTKKVYIACNWLFDEKLKLTRGGSQRYVLELTKLFKESGWNIEILQRSSRAFKTELMGVKVEGIKTVNNWIGMYQFSYQVRRRASKSDLVVYMFQESAFPFLNKNSIAVQHGLNWSGSRTTQKFYNTFLLQPFLLKRLKKIVCVDTAYINWVHTQIGNNSELASKLHYIPNFVENEKHKEKAKLNGSSSEKIVLFPRRMVFHRGALFAYDAMKILWRRGKKYKIAFCGPGPLTEKIERDSSLNGFSQYVEVYQRSFDEMPQEYSRAQVSIIPTIAFEGTSLSCIESMASGLPVITTHIGGLGNIVIPGFNGHCINMDVVELANAIDRVLTDESHWNYLSANGMETAKNLDIDIWRGKWKELIDQLH